MSHNGRLRTPQRSPLSSDTIKFAERHALDESTYSELIVAENDVSVLVSFLVLSKSLELH